MSAAGAPGVRGGLWLEPGGLIRGFAVDDRDPAARLAVELLADGVPIALLRAEEGLDGAVDGGGGDGCHGFSLRIGEAVAAAARGIVARLANRGEVLGALDLGGGAVPGPGPDASPGAVVWRGGTRLSGHVRRERDGDPVPAVRALIGGREVARAVCHGWVQLAHGGVERRFALDLPAHCADGRARAVEVVLATGERLAGSPCLAVAFPDPLADWIDGWAELESEKPRARFADNLLPRTLPFSEIEGWLERFRPPPPPGRRDEPVTVVVVGTEGAGATLESLERQRGVACRAAVLPAAGSPVGFEPRRLRDALLGDTSGGSLVVMAPSGTLFEPDALAHLADAAARHPEAEAVYPDLLAAAEGGRRWPLALPDFDPELLLETGYCGLVYALRRSDVLARPTAEPTLFGLFPGGAHRPREMWPVHLPFPLATLPPLPPASLVGPLAAASRARLAAGGEAAAVDIPAGGRGGPVRVRRAPAGAPVSAVVAARDPPAALERTLEALARVLRPGVDDAVIVDDGSSDAGTSALLAAAGGRGWRVLRAPGASCPARLLSLGAEAANGDHLLFLEAGVAGGDDGWLDEMRGRLAGAGVAAVGALVSWASGVVRDAGYALGPRCAPAPRFVDHMWDDPGYAGLLQAAHSCSALSAACLLTPRGLFGSLGAFDTSFPRRFFALDYCLRAAAAGGRAVFTPHASLTMHGAPPPGAEAGAPPPDREARLLFERWAVVPGCDPFYPPWMAMDGLPFSGLAWPPAPYGPRAAARRFPSLPPFPV